MSDDDTTHVIPSIDVNGCLMMHVANRYVTWNGSFGREYSIRIAKQILAHDIVQRLTVEQIEASEGEK